MTSNILHGIEIDNSNFSACVYYIFVYAFCCFLQVFCRDQGFQVVLRLRRGSVFLNVAVLSKIGVSIVFVKITKYYSLTKPSCIHLGFELLGSSTERVGRRFRKTFFFFFLVPKRLIHGREWRQTTGPCSEKSATLHTIVLLKEACSY